MLNKHTWNKGNTEFKQNLWNMFVEYRGNSLYVLM